MKNKQTNLRVAFWYIALVFFVYFLINIKVSSLLIIFGGFLILVTVLSSLYICIAKGAEGLPIFPVFSFTIIFKYVLPLVSNSLTIRLYSPEKKFCAALTVVAFLIAGIFSWACFLYKKPKPPKRYLSLPDNAASANSFLTIMFLVLILRMNGVGRWFYLGVAIQNFLDLVSIGIGLLAIFFLAYRWGKGELKKKDRSLFLILFTLMLVVSAIPIYLIEDMTMCIGMVAGYFLGSKKIPIILILVLLFPVFFMQYGKSEMRGKYWDLEAGQGPSLRYAIQPWQYPSFLWQWFNAAYGEITYRENDPMYTSHVQPLLERSSMVQLLLMVEDQTPKEIPFYYGATYSHILETMAPRFLSPKKISPLIGGRMLSLRYGLVPEERIETTSISWDMMIESYANFGFFGCVILGALLGSLLGFIEYWSAGLPILSFRFLYASVVLLFGFKASEMVTNTFVVSLFQTTVGLFLMAFLLMRFHRITSSFSHQARVPAWMKAKDQGFKTE